MFHGALHLIVTVLAIFLFLPHSVQAAEDAGIAPSASMNEQVLSIPGAKKWTVKLQTTVLMPHGQGPFPMVVMNHGSSGKGGPEEERYRFSFSSYYFLSRGFVVVLPMMQGFSGSDGHQVLDGCNQEEVGINNAKDIGAVIDFMTMQPYVDANRIIVAGQSFGGWNTLAFGAINHPGVKGLINFAGGASISNCYGMKSALADAAEHFGARTKVPSIWFYGDNDSKFSPSVWRSMHERYTQAGGEAELVAYGHFMNDSHNLLGFPEGLRIWAPKVDAFLAKMGLPNKIVHPEYLPMEFPPATHFAEIDDVNAVPHLNDAGRQTYRKFLNTPMPRVFIVAPSGFAGAFNGGFDPLGRGMNECRKYTQNCKVYAVDNDVVWRQPTKVPAPTNFAPFNDASAIPFINEAGRQGYQKYLAFRKPKAFVIAADGAWTAASLGEDPLNVAMESCKKGHKDCRFYAVDDDDVVWSPN